MPKRMTEGKQGSLQVEFHDFLKRVASAVEFDETALVDLQRRLHFDIGGKQPLLFRVIGQRHQPIDPSRPRAEHSGHGASETFGIREVFQVHALAGIQSARAGQLCTAGGFTVVKVAKPQQDMRFDVPTIGMGTLESLHRAGGRVLAVEADKTILVDEQEVIRFADHHGISIVAAEEGRCGKFATEAA